MRFVRCGGVILCLDGKCSVTFCDAGDGLPQYVSVQFPGRPAKSYIGRENEALRGFFGDLASLGTVPVPGAHVASEVGR